jgi:hypothetical protein
MSDCKKTVRALRDWNKAPRRRVGSGVDFKYHKVSPNINRDAYLSIRYRVYPQTSVNWRATGKEGFRPPRGLVSAVNPSTEVIRRPNVIVGSTKNSRKGCCWTLKSSCANRRREAPADAGGRGRRPSHAASPQTYREPQKVTATATSRGLCAPGPVPSSRWYPRTGDLTFSTRLFAATRVGRSRR